MGWSLKRKSLSGRDEKHRGQQIRRGATKEIQMANGKEQMANAKQLEFCSRFAGPFEFALLVYGERGKIHSLCAPGKGSSQS
jgi:hypothetical protein